MIEDPDQGLEDLGADPEVDLGDHVQDLTNVNAARGPEVNHGLGVKVSGMGHIPQRKLHLYLMGRYIYKNKDCIRNTKHSTHSIS